MPVSSTELFLNVEVEETVDFVEDLLNDGDGIIKGGFDPWHFKRWTCVWSTTFSFWILGEDKDTLDLETP